MVEAIENCFGMLAKDLVDVPLPMHIGKCVFVATYPTNSSLCA